MYCVTHTTVGGFTAGTAGHPILAFIGGMISHIVLDAVPHHDYKRLIFGVFDFSLTLGIIALFFWRPQLFPGRFFWGALGGALPDVEIVVRCLFRERITFVFPCHTGLTPHRTWKWPGGFWVQVLLIVAVVVSYCLSVCWQVIQAR